MNAMKIRLAFRLAVFGFCAAAISLPAAGAAARPPNVLLILSDDHGYGDLGCFGNPQILTPNLDKLAKEGVRLTSFYVAWPACGPSRAALLTGRYPQRNGIFVNIRNNEVNYGHKFTEAQYKTSPEMILGMDLREITIAQVLKTAGYRTGVFGKWDGGRARRFLPLQRGFDDFYGFANTGIDYWTHERYGIHSMFRGNERTREDTGTYLTHLEGREAVRFLKESAQRNQPFFLYLPTFAPHGASNLDKSGIRPPKKYLELYPKDTPREKLEHMAVITAMDEMVGNVLRTLDEIGQADNTLVIFFTDNGGPNPGRRSNNGPLREGKSSLFEGGIRVPFIARWPGRIPAGTVSDAFVTSLEVFPTLLKITGAPRPDAILDGFDMMPVLRGEGPSPRTEMFWLHEHGASDRVQRAARIGTWKWVDSRINGVNRGGLFDLSTDIGEKNDLSAKNSELVESIKARYEAWHWEMENAVEPRGPFRNY
jgi:arylsulfatase A-like enzyme